MSDSIKDLLPGFNCGICGFRSCGDFAEELARNPEQLDRCAPLRQERFNHSREKLKQKSDKIGRIPKGSERGILDRYEADFRIYPLSGEHSCREILHPLSQVTLEPGDVIRYRPLGCPVIHFATIREIDERLYKASITGPCHRIGKPSDFTDIGVCLVLGFEGTIKINPPGIGKTVRFIPDDCMMQKVHSGVVVSADGPSIRIELIDLKVWALPN